MAMEFVIRPRCDACGIAVEVPVLIKNLSFPCAAPLRLDQLPGGWTHDGDQVFCNQHGRRMVEPAAGIPAAVRDLRQIIGGKG